MSGHHDHGHGHGHGHSHARMCGGVDHHSGSYTRQQRADLDRVLAFNRRMAERIDAGTDVAETEAFLDPDPLRYMWVDEGQGRIAEVIERAHELLDVAPPLPGHERLTAELVEGSHRAARPGVAVGPDGTRLVTWIEWVPDQGDVVRAVLDDDAGIPPANVSGAVRDVFRPTALISAAGVPWVFFGATEAGRVTVLATRREPEGWTAPEPVSLAEDLSFNQEAVAHADGSVEVVWQGRPGRSFGVWSRRHHEGAWSEPVRIDDADDSAGPVNVWDPTLAVRPDGSTAYAWSEYAGGAYRVVVRERDAAGRFAAGRPVTSGTDYALHPHLAVTTDDRLWCAFDVITVAGHGGSGPTKLRPVADLAAGLDTGVFDGMRAPGDSIPPELLPEVSASIRVLEILDDGVAPAPGDLSPHLDVVPSGMPKLVATPGGGLTVAYRIHRRLPLMTYYWEVAVQSLTSEGWGPASTVAGTDGTLEEVAVASGPDGVVLAAQTDGRLEHALAWTEGFGGRECPYLMEHQGSVVWHGVHGVGRIVTTTLTAPGPVPAPGERAEVADFAARTEARRWAGAPRERYVADLGDRSYTLFWGDLHRHSLVSRCTSGDEPSLEDFYRYAWDVCEYDFWAVTDHSENSTDYQWWTTQKMADLFHVPGRFVPFYGFEWTSADHGHQNVIFGDVERGAPIFSAFATGSTDPAGLWAGLDQHPDFPAITIPHHPGSAMVHNDWDYHHPKYSALVEIFQACRGNYEGPGAFRQYSDAIVEGTFTIDGLMRGHKFGLIASSDHGHGASYVGAFADSLDRGSVFGALQQRRTFAATTRDVVVDLRVEGRSPEGEPRTAFMGEEVELHGRPRWVVHAEGYTDVARVDLVRNGRVVHAVTGRDAVPEGHLHVPLRLEWGGALETTVWDGTLAIEGGEVVVTEFVGPEVTAITPEGLAWSNTTHSFGELYGAQRGGVDVSLVGPPEAVVTVRCGPRERRLTLAELTGTVHELPGPTGHFRLQPGVGGLVSLGRSTFDLTWDDPIVGPAFFYARVFLADGEAAWSSPIWITPTPAGAPV